MLGNLNSSKSLNAVVSTVSNSLIAFRSSSVCKSDSKGSTWEKLSSDLLSECGAGELSEYGAGDVPSGTSYGPMYVGVYSSVNVPDGVCLVVDDVSLADLCSLACSPRYPGCA